MEKKSGTKVNESLTRKRMDNRQRNASYKNEKSWTTADMNAAAPRKYFCWDCETELLASHCIRPWKELSRSDFPEKDEKVLCATCASIRNPRKCKECSCSEHHGDFHHHHQRNDGTGKWFCGVCKHDVDFKLVYKKEQNPRKILELVQ